MYIRSEFVVGSGVCLWWATAVTPPYPPGAHSSIWTAAGVRVLALCGRIGRAGLPGALWCASPFLLAALSFCFAWPPPGWGCPPLSRCPCRSSLPWRCALVVFLVRSRLVFVPRLAVGCSLVVSPPSPSLFVSRGFCRSCLVPWCFFFLFFFLPFSPCAPPLSPLSPLSPAFSGFRPRVPWASALCVVCFVGLPPLGSPCACPSFVISAWLVVAPRWLLPPPPPPFCLAVFVAAARCCVPCAVLCCASLGAVLRRAAARCVLRCCAVLCCVVLVGSRCLLRRALWRCPLPWGPMYSNTSGYVHMGLRLDWGKGITGQ